MINLSLIFGEISSVWAESLWSSLSIKIDWVMIFCEYIYN